jgi:DNA-binding protein HU-beta
MTKTELVTRIAKDAALTKGQAAKALHAMPAGVEAALRHGERVTLVGFGTCAVRARAARSGRHPRTGQPLVVPARKTPPSQWGNGCARSSMRGVRGAAQSRVPSDVSAEETRGASTQGEGPPL